MTSISSLKPLICHPLGSVEAHTKQDLGLANDQRMWESLLENLWSAQEPYIGHFLSLTPMFPIYFLPLNIHHNTINPLANNHVNLNFWVAGEGFCELDPSECNQWAEERALGLLADLQLDVKFLGEQTVQRLYYRKEQSDTKLSYIDVKGQQNTQRTRELVESSAPYFWGTVPDTVNWLFHQPYQYTVCTLSPDDWAEFLSHVHSKMELVCLYPPLGQLMIGPGKLCLTSTKGRTR